VIPWKRKELPPPAHVAGVKSRLRVIVAIGTVVTGRDTTVIVVVTRAVIADTVDDGDAMTTSTPIPMVPVATTISHEEVIVTSTDTIAIAVGIETTKKVTMTMITIRIGMIIAMTIAEGSHPVKIAAN